MAVNQKSSYDRLEVWMYEMTSRHMDSYGIADVDVMRAYIQTLNFHLSSHDWMIEDFDDNMFSCQKSPILAIRLPIFS